MTEDHLHQYQLYTVDHIIAHSHCGVFLDMGLGKTVSTLTAIKRLIRDYMEISTVLIIAPKRVAEKVWTDEIRKWSHLAGLRTSRVIGTERQRAAALRAPADIYLISRDNVAWLCGHYGGAKLPFDMLVIDELSSFKSHASQRFKALRRVQASFHRVVGLTGTPAPNGLIDLWSQMWLLDRGARLGRTLGEYRDRYFRPDKQNGHVVYSYKLRETSQELIYQQIQDIVVSMKSEDWLDLKRPEFVDVSVDLGPKGRESYDTLERELVLALAAEQEITVTNAAALSNKLLQLAGGAIYDQAKDYHEIHTAKLDALEDLIEQANGRPVIVAYAYQHELERIRQRLRAYQPRMLVKDSDIDDWNACRIQVLLMHPASGGHGLNLQHGGDLLIWYGHTWSLELYQQLNKRLDRQGQTRVVTIYRLIATGTIDEDVQRALSDKTSTQEGLMQAVKARIERYKK